MILIGFGILAYHAVGYITGDFRALPSLIIFGLISLALGIKLWRNPDAH